MVDHAQSEPKGRVTLFERRQHHFIRAAVVGLLAGAVALLFQWSLYSAETARQALLNSLHVHPMWGWAVLPLIGGVVGGLVGWLTVAIAPESAGSGIPHVKAVLLYLREFRWARVLPVKFIAGVLGIGAGLSLGREGPTVQLGAAVGKGVGVLLRVPRRSRMHLITCGAGAGVAAAFNAPLAGFIFVIEELRRELSPVTYGTALIASVTADMVTRTFHGQMPSFAIHGYPMPPLSALPLVALVGLVCGLLGVVFNRGLIFGLDAYARYVPGPRWIHPAYAGILAGLVAWWLPDAVGGGHQSAERVLTGALGGIGVILALFVAKFALTVISYGSGAPGGIFAPLLLLGALIGLMIGQLAALVIPGSPTPAAFAVIGMAAYFSAIVRAPLTGIVLIIEMTGNYEQMFALVVACLTAYLVAERLGDVPIYEALLQRDIARIPNASLATEGARESTILHKVVESGSKLEGKTLRDAGLPPGCLVVVIERAGSEIVPDGSTQLAVGDELVLALHGATGKMMLCIDELTRGT
ncbi:MAG: sodium:proton antiporter [Planctomycetota bacterium]